MKQDSFIIFRSSLPDKIMKSLTEDSETIFGISLDRAEVSRIRVCIVLCAKCYPGKSIKLEEPIIHKLKCLFAILSHNIRLWWIKSLVS